MKIVIAGAGAVGFHLARELGVEGHDISIIDVDQTVPPEAISEIESFEEITRVRSVVV